MSRRIERGRDLTPMAFFWHPLSTVLLTQPPCLATPVLLRMLLAAEGSAELLYAGDRMWPALSHGDCVTVGPPVAEEVKAGSVVVVSPGVMAFRL